MSTWLQVFPGAWTAILVFLDNAGIWNLRVQNLDTWYLGQEVYINVVNPEDSSSTLPDNAIFCGALSSLQKWVSCNFIHVIKFAPQAQVYLFLPVLTYNMALIFFFLCREQSHRFQYSEAAPVPQWGETVSLLVLLACFALWLLWFNPHLVIHWGQQGDAATVDMKGSMDDIRLFFENSDSWFGYAHVVWCNSQKWEICRGGVRFFSLQKYR